MSKVQFALIREGNVSFGIVVVQDHVIDNTPAANQSVQAWSMELGVPTILLGARRHKLYGRPDLVRFMSRVHISRIPWRQANIAA